MDQEPKKAGVATHVVGIDLGGTKILAAVIDAQGVIASQAKAKTQPEKGPDAVIKRIAQTARRAVHAAGLEWDQILGMAVGVPGPVEPETGLVHRTPNLPGWEKLPLGPRLSRAVGVPVFLENDVNLGTLGESGLGAGRGASDMVGIFVGTGVGGGIILDGKLRRGHRNAAGEVGHMTIMADGPVCGCGKRGCLESVASRTAIERDIQLGLAAGRKSIIPKLTKGRIDRLTSGVLAKAVRKGDPLVTEVMERAQWYLGLHVASIVNLIDPEIVVLGGGVVEAMGDEFVAPIRRTAHQYFLQQQDAGKVRIVPATLGDFAVAMGAAILVRQELRQREA